MRNVLIALVLAALPQLLPAQAPTAGRAPSSDVITIPKMRADLEFLAGDALRGRLTDTPENAITLVHSGREPVISTEACAAGAKKKPE